MNIQTSNKIYVSHSKREIQGCGRGVFAKFKIKKGELIEKCPLIEITEHEFENLSSSILLEYLFFGKTNAYLALGYGSLYNHSPTPNAKYLINESERLLEIHAIKDINKDVEITFNYKGNSNLPLWFEV